MSRLSEQYERELRDPALTGLLKNSYAGDPALDEAPGRSERIMRLVLASGLKPARPRVNWAPFGWTLAATTALAAMAFAVLQLAHLPAAWDGPVAADPAPKSRVVQQAPQPDDPVVRAPEPDRQPAVVQQVPAPREQQPAQWIAPKPVEQPAVAQAEETPTRIAASLYEAGTAAHEAGDYDSAYSAYKASYDVLPTPNAMLASSDALAALAQQALAGEG